MQVHILYARQGAAMESSRGYLILYFLCFCREKKKDLKERECFKREGKKQKRKKFALKHATEDRLRGLAGGLPAQIHKDEPVLEAKYVQILMWWPPGSDFGLKISREAI